MDFSNLKYHIGESSLFFNNERVRIWAHPNEPINEHSEKTVLMFRQFIDEDVLSDFYNHFYKCGLSKTHFETFEEAIYNMVQFHDIGKLSFKFQVNKLKNSDLKELLDKYDLKQFIDNMVSNHSFTGSMQYFTKILSQLDDELLLLLLVQAINGHHTNIRDIPNDVEYFGPFYGGNVPLTVNCISELVNNKRIEDTTEYEDAYETINEFLEDYLQKEIDSTISFFYSYIYSLLITSDAVATSYFDKSVSDIKRNYLKKWNNRITDKLKEKMNHTFYNLDFNKNCQIISNEDLLNEEKMIEIVDINVLRTEMLKESSYNMVNTLKSNQNKRIFFLNMPTGAGKTNTSMKLALDILANTKANRIIYALPFINIIEQNYDILKDNFGLDEEKGEVRKIYSASESIFPGSKDSEKLEILSKDSFFDYPVICTTFVTFFNMIIKNTKRYKYALSSLTNSVVILDEVQSLPLQNWTSLYYVINEISRNYNIYFIIMSATLPEFDNLRLTKTDKLNYENTKLITNPKKYFLHALFDRTKIKSKIEDIDISKDLTALHDYLDIILSDNFKDGYNRGLIVLNTIKTSRIVFEELNKIKEKSNLNYDIDLLNSSLIPAEKKKIITKIKNMRETDKRYILASTQSVEAGVDVSFDFVVRDFATLDSIEQVRGRCNRNRELNKKDENRKGNAYIISIKRSKKEDYEYIYNKEEKDTKINESQVILGKNINYDYRDILEYYSAVSEGINKIQDQSEDYFIFKDRDNIEYWNGMNYSKILDNDYGIHIIQKRMNEFSFFVETKMNILINQEKIFSQLKIANSFEKMDGNELEEKYELIISEYSKDNFIFTLKELQYFKRQEEKFKIKIIHGNCVDGGNVIKLYKELIEGAKGVSHKKIIVAEFSSILYKFIFQVTANFDRYKLDSIGLESVGFFYLIPEDRIGNGENDIYSLKNGFDFNFFKKLDNNNIDYLII